MRNAISRVRRKLSSWRAANSTPQPLEAAPAVVPRRLNIGCGYDKRPGFLNIDVDPACAPDLLITNNDYSVIPLDHFEEIVAKDVLEHILRSETPTALLDWASWLTIGGTLWINTSSILGVAEQLGKATKYHQHYGWTICLFGNQVHHGDFHHTGFTELTLRVQLMSAGFDVGEFTMSDGWMFALTATKREAWDGYLKEMAESPDHDFLTATFERGLFRDPDPDSMKFYIEHLAEKKLTRRQIARHIFGSPEHLFKFAERHGL
jgi:Domain of unknown function (DUF4214)